MGPVPKAWVEKQGNLVWHRQHTQVNTVPSLKLNITVHRPGICILLTVLDMQGGHFAALELPHVLAQDVEDFVKQVWPVK